jgi:hypothetical protein
MKVTNQGVRDLLATVGPLTTREIAEFFPGSSHQNVAAVMRSLLNAARPTIHVSAWTRDNGYGKTYLRAIYSLGSGTNARKPRPFTNAEKCARRRAKYQIPTTAANSVFAWAATL